ncbi:MAG TPA: hypothetical protein VI461_05960 [Chitinophagaceae bacterium]|nr:hypothetical protein [Chitinophagaceae bacterium]
MKQYLFLPQWVCMMAIVIFSLCSCWPSSVGTDPYIVNQNRQKENVYYIPSSPNTSLLSEKNDLSLDVKRSSGSNYSGTDAQASYLPGKHIGITGSYSHADNESIIKRNRFELGSGYITQLKKGWHFETYAGFGKGKILNEHYTGSSRTNLTHLFLQPAFAISNKNKTVQFGVVSRFEGVNFKVTDTLFNNDREPFSAEQVRSLYDQPFHIMWQPGFVFRVGWKNFLFHTSYSASSDLTNPDLHVRKDNFSLGVSFRFNTAEKGIKK